MGILELAASFNQHKILKFLLRSGRIELTKRILRNCMAAAIRRGAVHSLRTLEKFIPGSLRVFIIKGIEADEVRQFLCMTWDCLELAWRYMNEDDRGLFFIGCIKADNTFAAKWMVSSNFDPNDIIQGKGRPGFITMSDRFFRNSWDGGPMFNLSLVPGDDPTEKRLWDTLSDAMKEVVKTKLAKKFPGLQSPMEDEDVLRLLTLAELRGGINQLAFYLFGHHSDVLFYLVRKVL
jgi:hypothetical protein